MNLLPIVLGVLFVLSWGSIAIHEKHFSFRKFQKMFHALVTAERSCHQKTQLYTFNALDGILTELPKEKTERTKTLLPKPKSFPEINPICARINLYPLIKNGIEAESHLAERAKETLIALYGSTISQAYLEKLFVEMIKAANAAQQEKRELALETLSLKDPELQKLYYKLLKGMLRPNLFTSSHFPPLTDHFKLDFSPSKICVLHAHPHALISFFGKTGALKIFNHLAEKKKNAVTLDELILAAENPALRMASEDRWNLLSFSQFHTNEPSAGKVSNEEGEIAIRRPS